MANNESSSFVSMKVPELQNFLKARDMHFKSCGRKGKEKGGTTEALQKCSRNDFVSKNFVFNFQSATFLTSSSISSWSMSVWQEAETDFFFPCLCFFQLAKNWLCCPYTEKHSRDLTKRHQTTQENFSREPLYRFYPLNFYFLFPISFIFLVYSDLFWIEYRWKCPVYYLF